MLSLEETAKQAFKVLPPAKGSSYILIEFPSINRKLRLQTCWTQGSSSLGCHSGTITGVTVELPYGGVNITPIDPKIEPPPVNADYTNEGVKQTQIEFTNLYKYIKEIGLEFGDMASQIFSIIVEKTAISPIYAISDVININAPARNGMGQDSVPHNCLTNLFTCNTSDFVRYLIHNKIGVVVASPVVQNPNHRSWGGYSLNQMWIWIHPKHLNRTLNCSALHNSEVLPSREAWFKNIDSDLDATYGSNLRKYRKEKTLLSAVVPVPVFMDNNRFVDGRDAE